MKVVIIHGQSHKGVSYYIGTRLLSNLGVKDAKEFFLPKDMPHFCLGCYACMKQGEEFCPHNQDMIPIWHAIMEADILVFTTPVYCLRTSGSMKAFLDHCFVHWIVHRPCKSMYFKKAVIISVGAGYGMKKAQKDIKTSISYWGISNIKSYGYQSQATSLKEISKDRKKEIDKDMIKLANRLRKPNQVKVSLKFKVMFMMMRLMQKKGLGASDKDKEYWKTQGWLDVKRPWHE